MKLKIFSLKYLNILLFISFIIGVIMVSIEVLNNSAVFFLAPSELIDVNYDINKELRIGGLVQKDSIFRNSNDEVTFIVTDKKESVYVIHKGFIPNLFSEETGVIVLGKFNDKNEFISREMLTKHDENYVPLNIQEVIDENTRDIE